MSSVIIYEKDVERLGKELIKEVYNYLHNERILSVYPQIKEEKERFLRKIMDKFVFCNYYLFLKKKIKKIEYEDFDEINFEDKLNIIKQQIENGYISTMLIFESIKKINIDEKIDEELYYRCKGFLNIYSVFNNDYIYLLKD